MGGDPYAAGMGYTMAVNKQQIGPSVQFFDRLNDCGTFPEGKEAGNIGKGYFPLEGGILEMTDFRKFI